ncbi:MAG: DUF6452 family protein [Flavobacteriaceae bacterium]
MNKNNWFLFIVCTLILLTSCENDDICVEPGTPLIHITFHDAEFRELRKPVNSLTVSSQDYGNYIQNSTTDSIAIPMDLTLNTTPYTFESEDIDNDLEFSYDKQDEFVSRACGYKSTFYNLDLVLLKQTWIESFEIINSEILDDSTTAIKIYH